MMPISRLTRENRGFTIIELMIAMSIFSVILVMSTVILIQIGSLYTKGVNAANLQNATRNITADVSAALQFGSQTPSPCDPMAMSGRTCAALVPGAPLNLTISGQPVSIYSFCIGSTRYSYMFDRELGTDSYTTYSTSHVLWRDTLKDSNNPCDPLDLTQTTPNDAYSKGDGYEMLPTHTRLTRFKISQPVTTKNIYNVDVWIAYGDKDLINTTASGHTTCNNGTGTQFCAVSEISTTLTGRVY